MSFTNEDLKQWKEVGRRGFGWEPMSREQILGILVRLEKAENSALDVPLLCRTFDYCETGSYSRISLDALERYEAWLVASGRKTEGK